MSDSEGAARPRRRRLRESGAPDLFMDLDSDSDDEAAAAEAPPGHEQVPAAPARRQSWPAGAPASPTCAVA
jgi:hypothetical protein